MDYIVDFHGDLIYDARDGVKGSLKDKLWLLVRYCRGQGYDL